MDDLWHTKARNILVKEISLRYHPDKIARKFPLCDPEEIRTWAGNSLATLNEKYNEKCRKDVNLKLYQKI